MHMCLCLKKHVIPNTKVNVELKNIYRGDEVKFAALFRALQPALLAEFLAAHPDFFSNNVLEGVIDYPIRDPATPTEQLKLWRGAGIKAPGGLSTMIEKSQAKYPVAYAMIQAFGNHCKSGGFSIVEPGGIIYRHTDVPARQLRTANIHIPLYIPKGDIGFEVEGEISTWDDVFAFNNQKLHSVWNNTPERRLVFVFQLTREFCGLPPADWTPGCNAHVPVFEKTLNPNYKPLANLL